MTTQTQLYATPVPMVRRALQADGIFCAASGIIFAIEATPIGQLMGFNAPVIFVGMGVLLFLYGIGLFYISSNRPVEPVLPVTIIGLNIIWVMMSVFLLVADPFAFTTEGRWATLIYTDIVAALAIWQYVGLRRLH